MNKESEDREDDVMKHCPKCRMESRSDADWCWHCGYSYEDAESRTPPASGSQKPFPLTFPYQRAFSVRRLRIRIAQGMTISRSSKPLP